MPKDTKPVTSEVSKSRSKSTPRKESFSKRNKPLDVSKVVSAAKQPDKRPFLIGAGVVVCIVIVLIVLFANDVFATYAAKVNGTAIPEERITAYIKTMRKSYNVEDDEAWAKYLINQNLTPATLRDQLIDNYIDQEIVRQFAGEKDCAVDSEEVQKTFEQTKSNYSDDEKFLAALQQAGMQNEDEYKAALTYSKEYQKLQEKFASEAEVDDAKLLQTVKDRAKNYDGAKKSSVILFAASDEEKAQKVLSQIKDGSLSFEDAAKENSTDTASAPNGGNIGWDKDAALTTDYQNALNELEKDAVSDLVKSDDGIRIIKCTDVYSAPDEVDSTEDVPSDILDTIKKDLAKSEGAVSLQEWLQEKKDSSNIKRREIPKNAEYNVDLSKYNDSDSSTDSADSADSVDSSNASTDSADNTDSADSANSADSADSADSASE